MNRAVPASGTARPLPAGAEARSSATRGRTGRPDDFDLIKQKLDFVGINYYTRSVTKARRNELPAQHRRWCASRWAHVHRNRLGGLPAGPHRHCWCGSSRRYGDLPVYITENGAAFFDPPTASDRRERQPPRARSPAHSDYLRKHLSCDPRRRSKPAVDIRGYIAVVAAGQPGMVAGLFQALRHGARELRDAGAARRRTARCGTRR